MIGRHISFRSEAASLEAAVQRARTALACPFSNSAEFEGAIIRAKRDAGAYGPKRRRRQAARLILPLLAIAAAVAAIASLN